MNTTTTTASNATRTRARIEAQNIQTIVESVGGSIDGLTNAHAFDVMTDALADLRKVIDAVSSRGWDINQQMVHTWSTLARFLHRAVLSACERGEITPYEAASFD